MPTDSDQKTLAPDTVIGGCRVIEMIGRGGMGEVYLAEDVTLGRRVAVKTLRRGSDGKSQIERFMKEAKMASQIDHANVVTIFHAGQEQGIHFIVMQFIDGQNLSDLLKKKQKPIAWPTVLRIIRMALRGLRAVHRRGLLHRDIKPSNIMLSSDSRVQLMDFGLVREETTSDLTEMGELLGTLNYMSPEQCRCEHLDNRSDIFSLGATMYALLAGNAPFTGTAIEVYRKIADGVRARPIHEINASIPLAVSQLVGKAMEPSRERRFKDAGEFLEQINQVLRSEEGDSSESFDTTSLQGILVDTNESVQEELVPLRSIETAIPVVTQDVPAHPVELPAPAPRSTSKAPRIISTRMQVVIGAVVVGLLVGLILVGYVLKPEPATGTPEDTHEGMVFIEAGNVQLGARDAQIREFGARHLPESNLIEQLSEIIAQEPYEKKKVAAFWIDKFEVTNAQYKKFIDEAKHRAPKHWDGKSFPRDKDNHPVVGIAYSDAEAYAEWAGKKLPTREQWMRAYRGDQESLFPWGDTYDPTRANCFDNSKLDEDTTAVDATPQDVSEFGVHNLVGNVCEFIRGTYQDDEGTWRVSKGGSFSGTSVLYGIGPFQVRWEEGYSHEALGLRCVIEAEE